ncbi:nucleotidyl transferase AbiEii/AbiGii toxin family protein [Pontibacter lucknowensis]|uniref:Predicted nucleotidyltransferase n=1 Tax=Pontibacter lucknowensis TaxID=1077936 RepID=A0A1N6Z971_9BACT|nr:nucleotidyl transferase AbiEii/AbiGii toxin family protein [Pontibacter lucknowensis]SIR23410.1 Predicted nucleotidyltransferase [Pontibacter lucknowensis]
MSSYKTNYKRLRQNPETGKMLEALERGFSRFNVDFYLVGAVARDVWMRAINDIAPKRTTGDIDFAVLINRRGVYEKLRDYLIEKEGFHPYHQNTFVLIWKNGQEVDLMPFGSIEHDGKVKVEGTGLTTLHVTGFKEVYEAGLPEVELEDSSRFKFCTIPGIVLLKLIAWHDRPEVRVSDIQDITDILLNYFEMFSEQIFDHHSDLFEESDDENFLTKVAAQTLGREVGRIAGRNKTLSDRLTQILKENTESVTSSRIAAIMASTTGRTVEDCTKLLKLVQKGITEVT